MQLLQPPVGSAQAGIPGWVLPAAVLLAGGDAASSLLDPSLPLLIAAGATTLAGTAVAGSSVLVPRLKQLPESKLRVEAVRQQLLGQYSVLATKVAAVLTVGMGGGTGGRQRAGPVVLAAQVQHRLGDVLRL